MGLMRLGLAVLIAAAPALAWAANAPAPAAPAPASPPAPTAPPAPPNPDLNYYPAAARAAGVEGRATIRCGRDSHLKLQNCSLVSESPAGQGFGAAALAMAAANQPNPKVDTTDSALVDPTDIVISFTLHPPLIDPDVVNMAHVITKPKLIGVPTREQLQAAYPVRALSDQVDGAAVLDCLVTAGGALATCRVLGERPDGYGFGQAGLEVAKDFKLTPRLIDGDPVDGAEVRVPVPFTVADPAGPLMLKTVPPPGSTPPPPQ
jgi:TonB family protein